MLVHEAIIDVAIGAAKFRGEHRGGMPILGCPGCNGETMEYVSADQQPPAKPAPAAGFDAVRMRRASRLTRAAWRGALLTPAPRARVVPAHHAGPSRSNRADQHAAQALTGGEARPAGTVQPPLVWLPRRVVAPAHDAQSRGHGAGARREPRAHAPDVRGLEPRLGAKGRACYAQSATLAGHGSTSSERFLAAIVSSFPARRVCFQRSERDKVELSREQPWRT